MRYFEVLGVQHFFMYLFPALAFIALFVLGLGFYHIRRRDSEEREARVIERFAGGIEGRNAPFPILAYLIVYGTVAWVLAYILLIGLLEVKI
jgi:hypothetical protein